MNFLTCLRDYPTALGSVALGMWSLSEVSRVYTQNMLYMDQVFLMMLGACAASLINYKKNTPYYLWPHSLIYGAIHFLSVSMNTLSLKLVSPDFFKCFTSNWPLTTLALLMLVGKKKYSLTTIFLVLISACAITSHFFHGWSEAQSIWGILTMTTGMISYSLFTTGFIRNKSFLTSGYGAIFLCAFLLILAQKLLQGPLSISGSLYDNTLMLCVGFMTYFATKYWINGLQYGQSGVLINVAYLSAPMIVLLLALSGHIGMSVTTNWSFAVIILSCIICFFINQTPKTEYDQ